ncbi:MAG: hypothetical protein RLZZ584_2671 [Pseudomonadota bacterium]|jgi:hypothetical protein
MLESEKFAVAAHLHVQLRRKTGRVTDVEWMMRNAEYAREIIQLALNESDAPDLHHWARRLEAVLFSSQPVPSRRTAAPSPGADGAPAPASPGRYVGRLR